MLERTLSDYVLRKLKAYGGLWRKNPVSPYGNAGVADIVGCIRGRYVEIELKAPGRYKTPEEGLTPLQAHHRTEVLSHGGWHIVADAWPTIEQSLEFLKLTLSSDELGPGPEAQMQRQYD